MAVFGNGKGDGGGRGGDVCEGWFVAQNRDELRTASKRREGFSKKYIEFPIETRGRKKEGESRGRKEQRYTSSRVPIIWMKSLVNGGGPWQDK
jgi:hypothetical protein